jgi:hypothetical protein
VTSRSPRGSERVLQPVDDYETEDGEDDINFFDPE